MPSVERNGSLKSVDDMSAVENLFSSNKKERKPHPYSRREVKARWVDAYKYGKCLTAE
jgi:hypothetical protein